jgi:hypothetical protein
MMLNSDTCKTTRVVNATAAGTTNINGSVLDMQNFNNVRFVCLLNALTAGQATALKAQQGNDPALADAADIAGAVTPNAADADSNKMLILDVNLSLITKRYVRCVVLRGTQNAVIDGVIADQYHAKKKQLTDDATTTSQATNAF